MPLPTPSKVLLVGSIPHPIGGVTQAVWRLIYALHAQGHSPSLLDTHPSPIKYPLPQGVPSRSLSRFDRALYPLRLLPWLYRADVDVIHYHFSSLATLRLFSTSLTWSASPRRRHFLTLHHGDQAALFSSLDSISRRIVRHSLHRFDLIFALSPSQVSFLTRTIGLPPERILHTSAYLPPPPLPSLPPPPAPLTTLPASDRLLVMSGYPSSLYGYDRALDFLDAHGDTHSLQLAFCLYGVPPDPHYALALRQRIRSHPRCILFESLEFIDFMAVLQRADLYLRPSDTDTTGIAVADCIHLGLPVIASDCTPRYPGCILFPTTDHPAFTRAILDTLARLPDARAALSSLSLPSSAPALSPYTLP